MNKAMLNVIADDYEKLAKDIRAYVNDDLEMADDVTIDEDGDPKEMPRDEKTALEEKRADEGLAAIVESNSAPEESVPSVTIDEVREKLVELSRGGKKSLVKALLSRYGADKLSSVKPEDYASLLYDASKECD